MSDYKEPRETNSNSGQVLICSTCGLEEIDAKTFFCTDCGSILSLKNSDLPDLLKGLFFVLGGFIGLMLFGGVYARFMPDGINGFLGFLLLLLSLVIGFLFGGLLGNKLLIKAWNRR